MTRTTKAIINEINATTSVLDFKNKLALCGCLLLCWRSILSDKSLRPAERRFMARRDELEVHVYGRCFRLWKPDLGLVRELYGHHVYFPRAEFVPKPQAKVIDLGANVGLFSCLCAGFGAEVIAVEAQSGFVAEAQRNFSRNGLQSRVRYLSALVASSSGVFSAHAERSAASHWGDEPPELSMPEIVAMFGPPPAHGRPDVHLLKADIEGSEFALLEGNLDWLGRIAHISMEVHPEFGDVKKLKALLEGAGFVCTVRSSWREDGMPKQHPGYLFAARPGGPWG